MKTQEIVLLIVIDLLIVVLNVMGPGRRPASQAITWQRTRPLRPTKRQLKRAYRAQRADLRRALKR